MNIKGRSLSDAQGTFLLEFFKNTNDFAPFGEEAFDDAS